MADSPTTDAETPETTYEITVTTTNPDFVDRLRSAIERGSVDVAADGTLHPLGLDVFVWDPEREKHTDMLWCTHYEPDAADEEGV